MNVFEGVASILIVLCLTFLIGKGCDYEHQERMKRIENRTETTLTEPDSIRTPTRVTLKGDEK